MSYVVTEQQIDWIPRILADRLPVASQRTLVAITGPRQAGKTSLAQRTWPTLGYQSLDDPELRGYLRDLPARRWGDLGPSVFDEAQKEPAIFDKIKLAFDRGDVDFTVLLGSAQILLMRHISETLAGRILVYELWPLMACELAHSSPLLARLTESERPLGEQLGDEPPEIHPDADGKARDAIETLLTWGGMPALGPLDTPVRRDWLRSYTKTYLERDLADLARLHDLQPFIKFQRLAAHRVANLLSFSELARDAGVSVGTARNYLEYLRISYQAFLLQPFAQNLTSSAVKTPKLYFTDAGVWRQITGQRGAATGALFENVVVAEIVKYLRTTGSAAQAFYYRTRSGMEVDLVLQLADDRILAAEIKNRADASPADARALRSLAAALGARFAGGLVITRGTRIARLDQNSDIWTMPAHRLLA
jgi:predicted AAA+ superfamily ATPase